MTGFGKYRMTEIYSPQQLGPLSVAGSPEASNLVFNHILVIEDDLTIAEDFVEYFWAMGYVLQRVSVPSFFRVCDRFGKQWFATDVMRLMRGSLCVQIEFIPFFFRLRMAHNWRL